MNNDSDYTVTIACFSLTCSCYAMDEGVHYTSTLHVTFNHYSDGDYWQQAGKSAFICSCHLDISS